MTRFHIEDSALYQEYAKLIDDAKTVAEVRQAQRRLQADQSAYHAIKHFINEKAREKIAALSAPADAAPAPIPATEKAAGKAKTK